MVDIGDRDRIGNPSVDPVTGSPLAAPPRAFTTGGAAADPSDVRLTVQRPNGDELVYGWPAPGVDGMLTRESVGRFYADVTYDEAGTWVYRLEGTGSVVAAEEGWVAVQRSKVLP